MILSAVSIWKKLDISAPLESAETLAVGNFGGKAFRVSYNGRKVEDGQVRISALFVRPEIGDKFPTVMLLQDAGESADEELVSYYVQKGYAVLVPDYCGDCGKEEPVEQATQELEKEEEQTPVEDVIVAEQISLLDDEPEEVILFEEESDESGEMVFRTVYPESLSYANWKEAGGLNNLEDKKADETCWFEWIHVAMYSIEYLKSRKDVSAIGVVGIRIGGALAWKSMLSDDLVCGVPINSVGWDSVRTVNKFSESTQKNLSDERHRYIAGIESQSYAPFVKCPVLMLCAMRDESFDCDRAYDTYSRIGHEDGSAIIYSTDSGRCIGPKALLDMDLFLEKHLKGRAIYVPESLNVNLKEEDGEFVAEVEVDEGGILEEAGIFYAEADEKTKSIFRNWQCVFKTEGKNVRDGRVQTRIKPFDGVKFGFVYAYAKYINGFQVVSKIAGKRFTGTDESAVKDRMIFDGTGLESFDVYDFAEYSLGGVFLEKEALPKYVEGYGGILGAYSVSGIKTYKISSPRFLPSENAMLKFDLYKKEDGELTVYVDVAKDGIVETYASVVLVTGGGKWKRIILKPEEFKGLDTGASLKSFSDGYALAFIDEKTENEFAVTNVLWL